MSDLEWLGVLFAVAILAGVIGAHLGEPDDAYGVDNDE